MPEGDTIRYAASRMRPLLEGRVPDQIRTPQPRHALDAWPRRLSGRAVERVDTHGKHLLLRFEGGLALHSHLRMTGSWRVYAAGQPWRRAASSAWLVLVADGHEVVQFDGPVLELLTDGRTRLDRRLAMLGPDVLAEHFDSTRFLKRLRADDPTRGIGDALLDQSTVAGIGNIWKAEGCWEAGVDPWRPLAELTDAEAIEILRRLRPRMLRSAELGPRSIEPRVHGRAGRPCPRCATPIAARGQGDENRTTFWCPGCQS
ncbi:MAG: Fpg/Nei family DNA glycosylase [Solirubrobacterales bacterium]|nr:Fpg/Nei family DNA glycosylase [Solirubrobacterales bacterium]MBV9474344.1 Fpg/Nei family DNA glycosylase [Solirubrobacterales bacterium]MBV9837603.1 Fpg/Nei family DNA glycosylase [Solirubrobacterales bacterium]